MEIRLLTHDEFDASMALSMYAFQYSVTDEQLEVQRAAFKPERNWGVFEEDGLKAKLVVYPLEIYLNGGKVKMGGIGGVATWPEERRKGHVAKLLAFVIEQMRKDGQVISLLAPFSFGFYRKFGWELFSEQHLYAIPSELLPARTETEGTIRRLTPEQAFAHMKQVYDRFAPTYNGMLDRQQSWWKESIFRRKPYYAAVYYHPDGQPGGYVLYTIEQRVLEVKECIYLDETSRRGLWTYLSNHDSMMTKVVLRGPIDDALPLHLADPRISNQMEPNFMARIVDLQALISQYRFLATGAEHQLYVEVEDKYGPWNEGCWRLTVTEEGEGRLESCEKPAEGKPFLRSSIQGLSMLLIGYKRPRTLWLAEKLETDGQTAELLEALLPHKHPYMVDYF